MRLFTGDELGNIKTIRCTNVERTAWKFEEPIVHVGIGQSDAHPRSVTKLATASVDEQVLLAAARSDGSLTTFAVDEGGALKTLGEFRERRFKAQHKFVGLESSRSSLYWCTSNGALARCPLRSTEEDASQATTLKASLPMNLCDWRLSPNSDTFAYGGQEVDVSVWDLERAFGASEVQPGSITEKKRSRAVTLFPGELWRAKNVPNDSLNLRQPIYITSLAYLHASSGSNNHLAAGTASGSVRRYDTRVGRRPVKDWSGISKVGGVMLVQPGHHEHELFVADHGCNLLSLDLRNGRTAYSYKKLSGEVNSVAPCPGNLLLSTAQDRFLRIHSTHPPPEKEGAQQEKKGEVLGSLFMKATPTALVYDPSEPALQPDKSNLEEGTHDDDIWANMQDVEDSDSEETRNKKRSRKAV